MTQGKQTDTKKVQNTNVPEKPAHETASELPVAAAEAHYLASAAPPPAIKPGHLLTLQRTIGNRATMDMMAKRNFQTVSLTNGSAQMKGHQRLVVNGENHSAKSTGQNNALIQRQITLQPPSQLLVQRDDLSLMCDENGNQTSSPSPQANTDNLEMASSDPSIDLESWEQNLDTLHTTDGDAVRTLRQELDIYLDVEKKACAEAIKKDKAAKLKLDEGTEEALRNYLRAVSQINVINALITAEQNEIENASAFNQILELEVLDEQKKDEEGKIAAAINETKEEQKQLVSTINDLLGVIQKGAAGGKLPDLWAEGIRIGWKEGVTAAINKDTELKLHNAINGINQKYARLASQLVPNTKLEYVILLKEKIIETKKSMMEKRETIETLEKEKETQIELLRDEFDDIKKSKTTIPSFALIQQFYQGSDTKGRQLRAYAESSMAPLTDPPNFLAIKYEQDERKEQIINEAQRRESIAASYYGRFTYGEDFAVAAEDIWMFNPAYLDWYKNNFLLVKTDIGANYEEFATRNPPPTMFVEGFRTECLDAIKDAETIIARCEALDKETSELEKEFQNQIVFASGPHIQPANELLKEIYNMLKESSP